MVTIGALAAVGLRFHTDPVPLLEKGYLFSHIGDISGHFMPQYHRGFSKGMGSLIGVHIGTTNPDTSNLDEDICGTQPWLFHLLKVDLIGGGQEGCLHDNSVGYLVFVSTGEI